MSKSVKKYVITSEQIFDAQKPKYNGFVGTGIHGDIKYNRRKEKKKFDKMVREYYEF